MVRRVMHVDMDAFYASVEQSDRPELKGKPVIVGGGRRGVVSAASYEARKFGIHSAMPIFQAQRLCREGVFLPVRMERYREVSRRVMAILSEVSPLVEQISIDEAFIDITGTESLHGPPRVLAAHVKRAVMEHTSLTCSVGIAPNRFLAKIASDMNKPDGLTVLEEEDVPRLLATLPVGRLPGVGEKSARKLAEVGVVVAADVLRHPLDFWIRRLGKSGATLFEHARGIDPSPVVPDGDPKSVSAEDTFPGDTANVGKMEQWLLMQAESVGHSLRRDGFKGKTITLKVKFADFRLITRSRTIHDPTDCTQEIFETASGLLRDLKIATRVRLIGVGVSNLCRGPRQTCLFPDAASIRHARVDRALDAVREKFGNDVLKRGRLFGFKEDSDGED
ncbi:MAG: DNA polymerase IV [Syntrophobacteraceae bacterium]|nr:DNA polymerase IV [Desulfobacteraceae bacterium]